MEKTFLFQQEAKNAKNYYKDKTDYENKNKNLTYEKLEAVQEKNVAKNAVSALTREIEWLQKQTVVELSSIDGLVRDRDKMIKDIESVEQENNANKMEIKLLENEKKTIKEQLTANKEHLKQMVQTAA